MIRYDTLSYDNVPTFGESPFPLPAVRWTRLTWGGAYRFIRYAVIRYETVRYALAVRGESPQARHRRNPMSHKLGGNRSQFVGRSRRFIPNLGTLNPKSWDVKSQFVGHNIPIYGTFNPVFLTGFNKLQDRQAFITLYNLSIKKQQHKRDDAALAKASAVCFISLSSYNSKKHVLRGDHV